MSVIRCLLCALLLAGLAGCGQRTDGPVVLHFWAMGREGEVVRELLPEFERSHPGIRVDIQQAPWSSAQQKLLTAFAGDVTPDICQLGNTWVPQFAALGALAPLDARLAASKAVPRADYFAGIWESNRIGEVTYGVPWYVDTRLLFYRTDLLAAAGFTSPPKTWAEWQRMLAALKVQGGAERFGVLLPTNEFEPLLVLALQQKEELLRDGGRYGNFRSAEFRTTLSYYLDMFRNKWAPTVTGTQISNVWDEFGRGYFTFYVTGPWNIGEFKRRLPAALQDKWTTAPMPGPNGPGVSVAGGASLVVFKASPHQQEAWQLVEYLSRPEVQQRFYELTGNLPARRSVWDSSALVQDSRSVAFRQQLELTRSPPKVPEWDRIATEMKLVTEALIAGQFTVDQAAAELDLRADRILEKRRSMLKEAH